MQLFYKKRQINYSYSHDVILHSVYYFSHVLLSSSIYSQDLTKGIFVLDELQGSRMKLPKRCGLIDEGGPCPSTIAALSDKLGTIILGGNPNGCIFSVDNKILLNVFKYIVTQHQLRKKIPKCISSKTGI